MNSIKVYCLDNSELMEFESINKGYRKDIFVKVDDQYFQLNIYDPTRLNQDFESEIEEYGYYSIEPNLILVNEVSLKEIKATLNKLFSQKYFECLKPLDDKKAKQENLLEIE